MAQNVIMPQMGESLAEGTITKWLKQVGDTVERDEPLFEISTDKVDAEIPSPASGTLTEIKVGEGETVDVNSVVATIGADGETTGAAPAAAAVPEEPASSPSPPVAPAPAPAQSAPVAVDGGGTQTLTKPYDQHPVETLRKTRSSPVVRNIADKHGIDIGSIQGTGISGRVTKKDILQFIDSGAVQPAASAVPAPEGPAPIPTLPAASGSGVIIPDLRIPPYVEGEPVQVEPMTVMRKKIAEHMVYSKTVAAHVSSFFEIDFEEVANQRRSLKNEYADKGVHLTYMPFIVRAVVEGLKKFPYLNAAVMGDNAVFKKEINVGIAVALDEGKGLIVPVIRNADERNLLGLARAINDLGERARTKKLMPEHVQRGTFSITNPGGYGGLMGTPIINQPQVAILGVGAIEKRPVVINDAIAIRHRAYFSLSYDHRLVDGAMAEMFMAEIKRFIEAGNIQ